MRRLVLALFLVLSVTGTFAQPRGGSQNKKAMEAFNKALAYNNARQLAPAIKEAIKAAEADEEFVDPHLLLGQLYMEAGDADKAIASFKEVLRINPDFSSEVYYSLGRLTFDRAEYEEASEYLTSYLARKVRKPGLEPKAKLFLNNANFAKEAIKHPQDFNPTNLGSAINSAFSEYYPALTADDNTIYYTRRLEDGQRIQEDFFVAKRDSAGWNKSVNLGGPVNTGDHNEGAPTISSDGRTMVFVVCEGLDGDYGNDRTGFGSCDLFITYKEGPRWGTPLNLGETVNSSAWESQPSLSSDGRSIYFVRGYRDRSREVKDQDIWITNRDEAGKWSVAEKVKGAVNTTGQESSVLIHPDGNTLYFSSDGHPGFGGEDIFLSRKEGDSWGTPINLGSPINTNTDENSITVSAAGAMAYFASDRKGGFGGLDLYQFELPANIRPLKVSYVKGFVTNQKDGRPLEASFQLIDLETKAVVVSSKSDRINGDFLLTLPANKDYALNVSRPGFLFHSENFSLKDQPQDEPKVLNIALSPIEKGETVVLRNVFFDTDKFDLKQESEVELDKLVDFLTKNSALKIEIGGHTDNVGDDAHNQKLSENRAKSVMSYLTTHGIDATRLTAFGYGESKPVADNEAEEGRAQNRRTEFKVL